MSGKSGKIQFLALVMTAGLVTAGLAGCGRGPGSAAPASSAAVSPTRTPKAPAQPDLGLAMSRSVRAATSFHVAGEYTYPHARLTLSVGLLRSGSITGSLVDNGEPIVATYVGGRMYAKVTRGFLAYLGKSRECRTMCGKYVTARSDLARSLVASMGIASTKNILLHMAAGARAITRVTYAGQPAYTWRLTAYAAGSYIVVGPLPLCLPLKVDVPGQFVLTFSQWNRVPEPSPPPASKLHKGPW